MWRQSKWLATASPLLSRTRAALGEERYMQALEVGRALSLPQAVAEAMAKVGAAAQPRPTDTRL